MKGFNKSLVETSMWMDFVVPEVNTSVEYYLSFNYVSASNEIFEQMCMTKLISSVKARMSLIVKDYPHLPICMFFKFKITFEFSLLN